MKEYDFRFAALSPIRSESSRNLRRVQEVRATILGVAGGFTELPPSVCQDLLPGDGMGYIVALKTFHHARALQARLSALALRWGVEAPLLGDATVGPRKDYCFFLIPARANPDERGRRRPLFTASRWEAIHAAIRNRLAHPVTFVYGEWTPGDSAAYVSSDELRMFFVRWESEATEAYLREFLQTYVFDAGRECDQWCLYLSVRGRNELVRERR